MNLTASAVSGIPMAIGDAAVTAVLGYAVVFFGLTLLMLVIILFGKVMTARTKAPVSEATAPQATVPVSASEAPGSAGELKLYGVSDRDAAMIMAIVANQMGKPLNELRFLSIREVK